MVEQDGFELSRFPPRRGDDLVHQLDDRHLAAERVIDRGHLETDDAPVDDEKPLRHPVQLKRTGRVDHPRILMRKKRQGHGLRPGRMAAYGGIDVLVNNAGIMKLARLEDGDEALIDSQIAINLKGTINTLREAAKRLRDGGRIVNFSTSVIGLKLETYGIYAATKSAVETLTGILSKELRGRSITVNAVAPGPTATALFLDGKSPELIERMSKMNPLERLGTPEDIAAAVAFLVGPDRGWINGQVLRANGGMV
jgi:NAD(P)-dependent dehydrogenase (short-subunit alcohol dehydrogenase family)